MTDTTRTQRYRTTDVQSDAGSFKDLLLPEPLVQALAAGGFMRPSPVQKVAIPIGRVGTDMIVQAKSGTGKTAVFAAVLLERVSLDLGTPQALVLAPTRELAIQSHQVIQRIAQGLPEPQPCAAVFVGGLPAADDEKRLRRTCHIVVGTPGRICALVTSGALPLSRMKSFVLDEADELLGSSFYEDVKWLIKQLPSRKQVLAFSATYTKELMETLEPFMRRPQRVLLCEETVSLLGIRQYYKLIGDSSSGSSNNDAATATSAAAGDDSGGNAGPSCSGENTEQQQQQEVQQQQQQHPEEQELLALKVDALLHLLSTVSYHQAVVFCNKKPAAEWLSRRLTAAGCPSACLFADLPQSQRMSAMSAVRGFKVRVIVSTDVLARGVDFDRVNLVVNLDLPADAATYVHRVGRTGRFGTWGVAVAFVTATELARLREYLQDVKGGHVSPLPETIPDDFYAFNLDSEWEKEALQQLLAAPKTTPPCSPVPLHKKHRQQQQQQQQQQSQQQQPTQIKGMQSNADEPFWVNGRSAWQQQQQQLDLALNRTDHPSTSSTQAAAAAAGGHVQADHDPAAAWDAWAEYYRSCGYSYPYQNPYRLQNGTLSSISSSAQQQQQGSWHEPWSNDSQQQQQHGTYTAVQECGYQPQQHWQQLPSSLDECAWTCSNPSSSNLQQQQQHWQQDVRGDTSPAATATAAAAAPCGPEHNGCSRTPAVHDVSVENDATDGSGDDSKLWCEDESEGYEVPTLDDELDPKAAMLLAKLQVSNAADTAVTSNAASELLAESTHSALPAAQAGARETAEPVEKTQLSVAAEAGSYHKQSENKQQQQDGQQYEQSFTQYHINGVAPVRACSVCPECWAASYAAWRRDYETWRQYFYAWCG